MVGRFWRVHVDERGQDAVEYALFLGFIAISCFFAISTSGDTVRGIFEWTAAKLGGVVASLPT